MDGTPPDRVDGQRGALAFLFGGKKKKKAKT